MSSTSCSMPIDFPADSVFSRGRLIAGFLLALLSGPGSGILAGEMPRDGERIYQQQCARCHGKSGQGVEDEFTDPLIGEKSVPQLTKYIAEWMPQDAPEKCTGEDAQKVARYIYDAFYSPQAQARNNPPRIELSRLTVRQYRNTVTDLVGGFRGPSPPAAPPAGGGEGEASGLPGRYFNKEKPRGKPVLERTDSRIDFHFGPSNPPPEELDKIKGFAARWEGSLVAPETGRYELVIRTNQAARLWLNDLEEPLIDAWVQSGDQTRHTASIFLLGGRAYPVRLDFSARQQGVDDKKKYDKKPREIFVEFRWTPPHGVQEVVPARRLMPEQGPELFVVRTPFPPDDRSYGYVRGISISEAWDEATTNGAVETAGYVVEHLAELSGVSKDDEDREKKLRAFCRRFVERAFRRPLSEPLKRLYIDRRFDRAPDLETAVKRVVLLTLKSPRFLYLDLDGEKPESYRIASRLAFALWDSLPDKPLREAAASGLTSPEAVAREARRMLDDPRARSKLREFWHRWLQLEHHSDLVKDREKFPEFDERLVSDLRTSLDLFLDDLVWNEGGDFRRLLRSDTLYLNGRLARYYGYDLPAEAPFQKVEAKHSQRAGVLSHPYMMAALAYTETSSPIHRGVFLIRSVLGRTLRPPPEAFTPVPPDLHPEMTTRERVAMQTKAESCQACHGLINPVGFTLEHFDATGRFRETEKGRPIDASGSYELPSGEKKTFNGAADLAQFLADNEQVHRAFVLQLFNHMVKQPVGICGDEAPDELTQTFAENDYRIPEMMAEIAQRAALVGLESSGRASSAETPAVSRAEPRRSAAESAR